MTARRGRRQHYFPARMSTPRRSRKPHDQRMCMEGHAHYYTLDVDGEATRRCLVLSRPKPEAEGARQDSVLNGVEVVRREPAKTITKSCDWLPTRKAAGPQTWQAPADEGGARRDGNLLPARRHSSRTGTRSTPPKCGCGMRAIRSSFGRSRQRAGPRSAARPDVIAGDRPHYVSARTNGKPRCRCRGGRLHVVSCW